ncbi:MAG TPA: hypothetical protein VNO51_04785 [Ilumatobacteraceae bacterium]|nr:hypothetical protein [Ilumatobacteraceae bacterium]
MQLIGREHELTALVDRLASRRVVTVVGPGGIGKTSLALAAAAVVDGRYPLGVHMIDLTRVEAPDAVGGAIAEQLGFPSFSALLDSPTDQPALLVVDNCEHVIDGAATAIAQLVDACAAPVVLATSRSPLDIAGESLVVLGPLTMPGTGVVDPDVPSVRLFLERASDAGVELGADQLQVVGELCRALDGLPLALEMAAARTRVMTPAEILSRLGDLDTLARPRFRGADRHRSLRSTIEWSYEQLTERDRLFFDRLGVLAGRFDVGAAHAVASEPDHDLSTTLSSIDSLLTASLLVADQVAGVSLYHQLATLRTYALEQLAARGETDSTWERFVGHVIRQVIAVMTQGRRGWDTAVLGDLLDLYDDISASLRWCVEHDADPDRALILLSVLWGVVQQGHAEAVSTLGEAVLERWPEPTAPLWADGAATVATCRYLLGLPIEAIELADHALSVASGSLFAPCTLRRVIGQAHWAIGDAISSLDAFEVAAAEARQRDIVPLAMELDVFRAHILAETGETDAALSALRASRDEAHRNGSDINEAWAITTEGYVLLRADISAAATVIDEALEASRRFGYPACISANLQALAILSVIEGRIPEAADRLIELLGNISTRGAVSELRTVLHVAAVVLERAGNPLWADLAASAASLPVVSMFASPGHELLPLPTSSARPMPRRDATLVARRELVAIRDGAPVALPAPDETGRRTSDNVFALVGDVWDVAFAGRAVSLRSSKGMVDLARLLASPGRDVHCLDLVGATTDESSTGESIDATARRQYEDRIRELQVEIDTAEAAHDHARAERAHVEFDAIVDHLTAALGLGGRVRSAAGSTVERARSAVTQRVRTTIKRLMDVHPELARHLTASVSTGIYCSYRPEHPTEWRT